MIIPSGNWWWAVGFLFVAIMAPILVHRWLKTNEGQAKDKEPAKKEEKEKKEPVKKEPAKEKAQSNGGALWAVVVAMACFLGYREFNSEKTTREKPVSNRIILGTVVAPGNNLPSQKIEIPLEVAYKRLRWGSSPAEADDNCTSLYYYKDGKIKKFPFGIKTEENNPQFLAFNCPNKVAILVWAEK